jgi:hypothetical protein
MVKVNPEALRVAAHECRVGAGRLAIAAQCHLDASRFEYVEHSILALLEPGHEALADMLQRRLEKASTTLSSSALALVEAARKYEAASLEATRLLDPEAGS